MKTGSSVLLSIGLSLLLVSGGPTLVSQSAPASRAQLGQAYQERVFDTDNENRRRWSNNSLISFRQHGKSQTEAVSLYNEDGRITREAIVSLPEAEFISLSDATLDNSGSLFVSGGSSDVKGRVAHFIAQLNESGRVSRVVRTTPFMARQLCVAKDDGTIWAFGGDQGSVKDSAVLEQYSLEKGLLRALFPRTELGPEWRLLDGSVPEQIHLACNRQKVVLFNAESDVLLEYDLLSDQPIRRQLRKLPGSKDLAVTGFCMTKDGLILASLHEKNRQPPMSGVFQLTFDNSRGQWVPLEETLHPANPGSDLRIVGTNGTDVIYSRIFEDRSLSWARLTH